MIVIEYYMLVCLQYNETKVKFVIVNEFAGYPIL